MLNKECYLCKGNDIEIIHNKTRDNKNINVLRCKNCGLVFLSSFNHSSNEFYENSGMQSNSNIDFKEWQKNTFNDDSRRYSFLRDKLTNKNILDFGCGNGGFLELVNKISNKSAGVELDKKSRDYLNNKNIRTVKDISQFDEKFDIITMFHVIEHLDDPLFFLNNIKPYLKEKGELIIETPNANDVLLSLYNSNEFADFTYWSLHLILYTSETLIGLLKKAGFDIKWETQVQRYPISNHLGWLSKKQPLGFCENNEFSIFNDENLNREYERILKENHMCDTLLISAKLKNA